MLARTVVIVLAASAILIVACKIEDPPNRPVDVCTRSCSMKAARQCSEGECRRGCQFILDRLAEHEGDPVIACVASRDTRCSDPVWADCAVRVGVHSDGGPPGPPPPHDEWE